MPRWPKRKERPGMDRYGRTPLWHHCFNGDLQAASEAIAAGADPSFGDDVNYSPLHVAVQEGRVAVIRLLLASGADPNKTDNHGNSPLWTAVLSAPRDLRVEIITLHLEAGAEPDHKNRYGHSPRDAANKIANGLGKAFVEAVRRA
jgi:uncharacterized protein